MLPDDSSSSKKVLKHQLFFPTPLYSEKVENALELNKHLFKTIKECKVKNEGLNKTNRGGWHSPMDLHLRKEFKPIVDELLQVQNAVSKNEGYTSSMDIKAMWANINYPGSYNVPHVHPNSNWSGAYYVKVPKDSGNINFHDPRIKAEMIEPEQLPVQKLEQRLWKDVTFIPKEGDLILFPAYLTHEVFTNDSKEKDEAGWRVSISFNLIQSSFFYGAKSK
tara:strand:+ start:1025 stop:1687 length:663 start_codon:yes stop_codon:yes gene_type:complete